MTSPGSPLPPTFSDEPWVERTTGWVVRFFALAFIAGGVVLVATGFVTHIAVVVIGLAVFALGARILVKSWKRRSSWKDRSP